MMNQELKGFDESRGLDVCAPAFSGKTTDVSESDPSAQSILPGSCFPRSENPGPGHPHYAWRIENNSRSFAPLTLSCDSRRMGPQAQDDTLVEVPSGLGKSSWFSVADGGGGEFLGAVHHEWQRDQDCGYGDHYPDDIYVGEKASLDVRHAVDLCSGVVDGVRHG